MSSTDSKPKAVDSILIRRLSAFLVPYKGFILLALGLTLVVAWLGPLRPYITQIAVDDYIAIGDYQGLWRIIGLFALVLVGEFFLLVLTTYLTRWIGQGALFKLRTTVFRHIAHLHVQYFDRNPIGRLITRTTSDIEVLSDLLSNGVVNMIGDLLRIVFIMYFMFMLNWELAFVSLITVPILFYATILFKRKVRVAFLMVRDQVARLNSYVQEHINGLSIVQLFGQEKREAARFEQINQEHTKAHIHTIFYFALFWPVVEVLSSVAMTLVIWYGGARALSDAVTFGVLLAFIQYVRQFFQPIRDLSDQFNTLQSALASSERIFSVLDTESKVKESESPIDIPNVEGRIDFQNVDFNYIDNEPVLRSVSFTVEPGTMVAIVGATGAGKSTIINLITRFYDIQSGSILLDGNDIKNFRLKELRAQFGLVLQDNALFSGSILENITLGNPDISREAVMRACAEIEADEFIQKLPGGLDYVLQERGGSLSMGQKQLICFLRAMVYDPKILILDEATSSIDSETESLVTQAFETLMRGRTAIVIAHRLSTIQHADKIIVMHKGEIREEGTHDELIQVEDGIYRKLYELQYRDQVA
jgi:ATP-binding cassette subfamily B protein